ncbi:WXG100 family type VII secretion target [Streptomyces sp. ISID311]|uniref:WXG100 family type VII secretion target n=1 Tax=Streptomyces TaxID=1883 RepID=UPI0011BD40BE|nr:WXG100 family type VII secretion target [Streptomyces sp. ISID311]TXC95853.1 WXG100 family type VII secretion target [Streptomyces sp. ISID311]
MSGMATGAFNAYSKVNDWMSGFDSAVDSIMRPLVEPLAEHLECVTGDDEGIQEAAKLWRDQAADLRDLIADQRRDRADLAHEWTGEAAEAFQGHLAEMETALQQEADDMDAVADVLEQAAEQCRLAEQVVTMLIQELIEWALIELAVALATSIVTAGVSVAAMGAMAVSRAGITSARIAEKLKSLAEELRAFVRIIKLLKKAKKMSKVKKLKPWTWKHLKEPDEARKFATALAAKKALKVAKIPMKGAVGLGMAGLGFTGDPTQAASPIIQHEAEKIDAALSGDDSKTGHSAPRTSHGDVHLPPASDFEAPPVAQDPLNRYREPAVEQDPRLVTRPATAQQPRDPDNPFG